MIDLIERTRKMFNGACGTEALKPVKYVFFNTGLEMKATKDHVKAVAQKCGVQIEECRPKVNIVKASREHGIPFVSKIMSGGLEGWQKKNIPLSIADEYAQAEDKAAKRKELKERYPKSESIINFLCCCNSAGELYNEYRNMKYRERLAILKKRIPIEWLYGYGYYGHRLSTYGDKFYVVHTIGSHCD